MVEWEKWDIGWLEHIHVGGEDRGVWHWKWGVVCRAKVVRWAMVVGRRRKWRRGEASATTPIEAAGCGIWAIKVWDAQ